MKWDSGSKHVYDYDCRRQFTREAWKEHEHSNGCYRYYVRALRVIDGWLRPEPNIPSWN